MPSSRKYICASLTIQEENDSQSDHDANLDDTTEIGSDYELGQKKTRTMMKGKVGLDGYYR